MIVQKSTKELLADSFHDLMNRKSFEKIKIEDITKNCGVARSTFYRYFHDKYDLANYIYLKQLEDNYGHIAYTPDLLEACLKFLHDNRAYFLNLSGYIGQNSFQDLVSSCSMSWWEELSEEVKEKDQDAVRELHFAILMFSAGTAHILTEWVQGNFKTSIDDLVAALVHSIPQNLCDHMRQSKIEKYSFV